MLSCLKNSKDSWFGMFKEALKKTGKFVAFVLKCEHKKLGMLIHFIVVLTSSETL